MRLYEHLSDALADWGEKDDQKALTDAWREFKAQIRPPAADSADPILERIKEAVKLLRPPDPNLETEADREAREAAAVPALRAKFWPPLLAPAAQWKGQPIPAPVLWRDRETRWPEPVLSVGEIALLSSAGGLGKSYLTLALADAAARSVGSGEDHGSACGLRVRPGPVVLVSYEDAPARIADRLHKLTGKVRDGIHVWPDPHPLWQAAAERGGDSTPGKGWRRLWQGVRELQAVLVVIDPASAVLADVSTSETGPVRAFLRAATQEAQTAGCGVLIVAHDTKAARNAVGRGEDPGAGVVAGSAAWYDGARGVLTLWRDKHTQSDRMLACVKCNYGPVGWGARLQERMVAGRFCGLELVDKGQAHYDRSDLEEFRRSQKNATAATGGIDGKSNGRKARTNGAVQPDFMQD